MTQVAREIRGLSQGEVLQGPCLGEAQPELFDTILKVVRALELKWSAVR